MERSNTCPERFVLDSDSVGVIVGIGVTSA